MTFYEQYPRVVSESKVCLKACRTIVVALLVVNTLSVGCRGESSLEVDNEMEDDVSETAERANGVHLNAVHQVWAKATSWWGKGRKRSRISSSHAEEGGMKCCLSTCSSGYYALTVLLSRLADGANAFQQQKDEHEREHAYSFHSSLNDAKPVLRFAIDFSLPSSENPFLRP